MAETRTTQEFLEYLVENARNSGALENKGDLKHHRILKDNEAKNITITITTGTETSWNCFACGKKNNGEFNVQKWKAFLPFWRGECLKKISNAILKKHASVSETWNEIWSLGEREYWKFSGKAECFIKYLLGINKIIKLHKIKYY